MKIKQLQGNTCQSLVGGGRVGRATEQTLQFRKETKNSHLYVCEELSTTESSIIQLATKMQLKT